MTPEHHDSTAGIDAYNPFLGNHLGIDGLPNVTGASIRDRVDPSSRSAVPPATLDCRPLGLTTSS